MMFRNPTRRRTRRPIIGVAICTLLAAASFVGLGTPTQSASAQAVTPLQPGEPVTKYDRLDISLTGTCATLGSGQITCVGRNPIPDGTNGSLIRSSTTAAIDAVGVGSGRGDGVTCIRQGSGYLNCFGAWRNPVVYNATTRVDGIDNVVGVDGNERTSCAVKSNGQVVCVGDGSYGQRGDGLGGLGQSINPGFRTMSGISTARQVATGEGWTCAVLADGTVQCTGSNWFARFILPLATSNPGPNAQYNSPVAIPGLTNVNSISLDYYQGCALITDGTVKCFASNTTATATSSGSGNITPTAVAGISTARAVAAGLNHGCALLADGTVTCWGTGSSGQLGRTVVGGSWQPATLVPGITNAISIHAGGRSTCAVLADGTVKCWGENTNGQLGLTGASIFDPTIVPAFSFGGKFTPTNPLRILNTRAGAKPTAGSVTTLQVRGVAGVPVPASANGVLINVTAVDTEGDGYITVFPCTATPPNASNLNYNTGQTIPNLVAAPLSVDGKVCLFTSAKAHLLADLAGYYDNTSGSNFSGLNPDRLLDTRGGIGAPAGKVAANGRVDVQVVGVSGVPAGATGVVLNVTVDSPEGDGYITVFPCTATPPDASNLNYTSGLTIPNLVSIPVSAAGKVCFYTYAKAHLIADVAGYYGATGPAFAPVDPIRLLDTRVGTGAPAGKLGAGQILRLRVRGVAGGTPAEAQTVVLNVTAVDPSADGYASVYPCTATPPNASNLNFRTGRTIPNLVMMPMSATGEVCIFSSAAAHFLADINGHYRPL